MRGRGVTAKGDARRREGRCASTRVREQAMECQSDRERDSAGVRSCVNGCRTCHQLTGGRRIGGRSRCAVKRQAHKEAALNPVKRESRSSRRASLRFHSVPKLHAEPP
eukprot:6207638-Pleurochrysis_carterae.AAC.1